MCMIVMCYCFLSECSITHSAKGVPKGRYPISGKDRHDRGDVLCQYESDKKGETLP